MVSNNELLELTSVEMRRRIGTKEISPVELLEASIARIEALNPAVNAIAATDFATARKLAVSAEASARKGEPLGPLHGLPTGIKDLHETAGLLTTYGSPLHRGFVPQNDAAMVALVRKAGAIILCKTNVPEFGAGANTRNLVWGATGNPFDPKLNAGGSSGGAAVALACDMLPVCTGSDTGGSLRIGLQITGQFRADRDLLDAGEAMEQAFAGIPALERPRPDLGKLAKPSVGLRSIVTYPPLQ